MRRIAASEKELGRCLRKRYNTDRKRGVCTLATAGAVRLTLYRYCSIYGGKTWYRARISPADSGSELGQGITSTNPIIQDCRKRDFAVKGGKKMTTTSHWAKLVPFVCLGLFVVVFGRQMLIYQQAETQVSLGIVSYQQKNYAQAEAQMRRALVLNADNAYASYYLGLCLVHNGNIREAKQRLETAQFIAQGSKFMARNELLAEETTVALDHLRSR